MRLTWQQEEALLTLHRRATVRAERRTRAGKRKWRPWHMEQTGGTVDGTPLLEWRRLRSLERKGLVRASQHAGTVCITVRGCREAERIMEARNGQG